MTWLEEVQEKHKRRNQMLFDKKSSLLQGLIELMQQQNRQVIVLWAFEFVEKIVDYLLGKYPDETRALEAFQLSKLWATGKIKMPEAKQGILACHSVSKEINSAVDQALFHAVGQGCSVVHTPGHAIGLPIYELTAIVKEYGIEHCQEYVEQRYQEYIDRLLYWQKHYQDEPREWAKFLK